MGETNFYAPGLFCWDELRTRSAAAAKRFYTELLGWTAVDQEMPGGMGTYTILQAEGKDQAGLCELSGPRFQGVPSHWMSFVAVADADATTRRALALGAEVLREAMDVPGVGRMVYLKDPTGASFELYQAGGHRGAAKLEGRPGSFCWHELMTGDTKKATDFYSALFGWKANFMNMGAMDYTTWMQGTEAVGGMMAITREMGPVPPNWLPYIAVGDCDGSVKRARDMGATVIVPPRDVPAVGRFATLMDPSGAAISIIQLAGA